MSSTLPFASSTTSVFPIPTKAEILIQITRLSKQSMTFPKAKKSPFPTIPSGGHLKDAFRFHYTCWICSLPLLKFEISDTRCVRIQHVYDAIWDPYHVFRRPDAGLPDSLFLLQLLEEEFNGNAAGAWLQGYTTALFWWVSPTAIRLEQAALHGWQMNSGWYARARITQKLGEKKE